MNDKIKNLDKIKIANINKKILDQDYIAEAYDAYQSIFQCLKIETLKQLEWLIKETKNERKNGNFIFRGQRDCHWKPISSLEREITSNFDTIKNDHLENFRQLARGKINEQFLLQKTEETEYINEIWAVGQHMGLKTPLLDWSKSFFISLFFAFEERNNNSPYRAVFCLDSDILYKGENYVSEFFEPISDPYGRLTAQQGLFLTNKAIIYAREKLNRKINNKNFREINIKAARKYFINNKLRDEIIDYLDFIGIRIDTVYPDIQGVIKKVNRMLLEK
ncbi:FRG domain-containing protein [Avibacterium avium]|uniref:FRG domain-containing protein n=1 Tax=Avibacterium avium TaxID=751 RepID=UPI003BF8624A